jgi:hypothetical protein
VALRVPSDKEVALSKKNIRAYQIIAVWYEKSTTYLNYLYLENLRSKLLLSLSIGGWQRQSFNIAQLKHSDPFINI